MVGFEVGSPSFFDDSSSTFFAGGFSPGATGALGGMLPTGRRVTAGPGGAFEGTYGFGAMLGTGRGGATAGGGAG